MTTYEYPFGQYYSAVLGTHITVHTVTGFPYLYAVLARNDSGIDMTIRYNLRQLEDLLVRYAFTPLA